MTSLTTRNSLRKGTDSDNAEVYLATDLPNSLDTIDSGLIRAWGMIDTTGGFASSYNITSVTDNGVGDFTVHLSITMPSTNYLVLATPQGDVAQFAHCLNSSKTTTAFRVNVRDAAGVLSDPNNTHVMVIGG